MSVNIKQYLQQRDFSERIIIVCDKGSVFVDITYSPNGKDRKAVIWGLFVGSGYRCNGVGNDLLLYAEEQVKVRGIREVEIAWESPTFHCGCIIGIFAKVMWRRIMKTDIRGCVKFSMWKKRKSF